MLLRKPYAFLIKYFRLLHFFLTLLMGFVAFKLYNVSVFLDNYLINGSYTFVVSLENIYLPNSLYWAVVAILIVLSLLLLLLIFKKKPAVLYIGLFICYLFTLFFFSSISTSLLEIEISSVNLRNLSLIKDVSRFLSYFQAVLLLWILLRALGFDISRFKFGEDIKEFRVESNDNEEFEFTVNVDKENIWLRIKRRLRMFRYTFLENKIKFIIIPVLLLILVGGGLYLNKYYFNKVYKENESVQLNNMMYSVQSSYVLNRDFKGKNLGKNYVVVKYNINNTGLEDYKLDLSKYYVEINGKLYSSSTNDYDSFIDIGKGYSDQNLLSDTSNLYILIFKIDNYSEEDDIYFKIPSANKAKSVLLTPITFDSYVKNDSVNAGYKLSFEDSVLKKSDMLISGVSINDIFLVNYTNCDYGCKTYSIQILPANLTGNNTILKLEMILNIDKSLNLENMTGLEFLKNYAVLKYNLNGKTYTVSLLDKTPSDYKGNNIYLEVPADVKDADSVYLEINLRNEQYTLLLK